MLRVKSVHWATREAMTSPKPKMYKPAAGVTTIICFAAWQLLTGRAPTRVTKRVEGLHGMKEAGGFAAFLTEVFNVLGIKASAAGQIRAMQRQMRTPPKIP